MSYSLIAKEATLRKLTFLPLTAALIALLVPTAALAQGDSSIAGQVTDNTGGVLPGVTVEVASPALIEGSRVAVTDGNGQYAVTSLSIGTYTVMFTLPGFSTILRDGVELASDFTANIDAELNVGSVEETITVSGESPLVDVQRTTQNQVISREAVDALPTGRNPWAVGMTLPGMTTRSAAGLAVGEVGGVGGAQQNYLMRHGSDQGDSHTEIDGMNVSSGFGGGEHNALYHDDGIVQEYSFESIGGTSEHQTSGVTINLIPREGSNTFSGSAYSSYGNESLYTSNYSAEQATQGLKAPSEVKELWDYNFGLGGPLAQDRLWFFTSWRSWGNDKTVPYVFEQPNRPSTLAADGYSYRNELWSGLLRLTSQINPSNKVSVSYNRLVRTRPNINTSAGPNPSKAYTRDATMFSPTPIPYVGQAKWTSTLSNRTLLEAGYSINHMAFGTFNDYAVGVTKEDTQNNTQWNGGDGDVSRVTEMNYLTMKLSYITGSHTLKTGIDYGFGYDTSGTSILNDLHQQYRGGVPTAVQVYASAVTQRNDVAKQIGFFIQDAWTVNRLTVNGGVRFDHFMGRVPAQCALAGRFAPARCIDSFDTPTFNDISPRLGLAYDLSGDGRTALKVAIGRYVEQEATGFASGFNTLRTSNETRPWGDVDISGTCAAPCATDGDDIAQDGEIGATRNVNFGLPTDVRNVDPNGLNRANNYSINVNLEHELRPGVSISGGYYYRKYSDFRITNENLAIQPSDYLTGQVADPRGNGQSVDVSWYPSSLNGLSDIIVRNTDNTRNYNGFDINLSARFGDGGLLSTGFQAGKQLKNDCDQENPNGRTHGGRPFFAAGGPFCDQSQYDVPFDKTFKLSGAYPLPGPGNFMVSAVYQSVPGDIRTFTGVVTRRNIFQANIPSGYFLIPFSKPGEEYLDRHNQLDIKISGRINAGGAEILPELGIYNAMNVDTVLVRGNIFGGSFDKISAIIDGRVVRLGARLTF